MGRVAALATARVHVLVVAMPGHALLRARTESAARRRGWPVVDAPEQADLLVVCGAPTRLSGEAAEHVWSRVVAPRARRRVLSPAEIGPAFDSAARVLADVELQRAERAAPRDRDEARTPPGSLQLGPLSRGWPGGLLVTAQLTDDRITGARIQLEVVAAEEDDLDEEDRQAVLLLERAAAVLRLAGWPAAALEAERQLDGVLRGRARRALLQRVRALRRRVGRSAAFGLAVRTEVRDGLLDVLLRAERALFGIPAADDPPTAAEFVAALVGRTPLEAQQWAAATGRPELRRAPDG